MAGLLIEGTAEGALVEEAFAEGAILRWACSEGAFLSLKGGIIKLNERGGDCGSEWVSQI